MNETVPALDACGRCGCPLSGNESYCSNCGHRVEARWTRPRLLAAALVLIAFAAAGTCAYRSRHLPPARAGPPEPVRTLATS